MTYPPPAEIILTQREAQLLRRLLMVMSMEQLEDFAAKVEQTVANHNGDVIVRFYKGHPRFIGRLEWEDWRE
jgi:hypothetical protein